jgi:hypothetical protein
VGQKEENHMNPQAVHSRPMSAKLAPMHTPNTVFGNLPMTAKQLIDELKRRRFPRSSYPRWKPGRLTEKIFADLKKIGERSGANIKTVTRKGLTSYFKGNTRGRSAFLLDFLWWNQGFGTALAVECELSDRRIKAYQRDFEKLLCWKSPMKLMIVREINKKDGDAAHIAEKLSEYAREAVHQFVKNECYLLLVFGHDDSNKTRWFMYCASQNHCDLPKDHRCSVGSQHHCFEFTPYPASETTDASMPRQRRRRGRS